MKTLILALFVFVASNVFSQTTVSVGEANFFSYSPGKPAQFKLMAITSANQTFGDFTTSGIVAATVDSSAKGYIGAGVSYQLPFFKNEDENNQALYISLNAVKGEQSEALMGASLQFRQEATLFSLTYERDIVTPNNWIGFGVSQIILK